MKRLVTNNGTEVFYAIFGTKHPRQKPSAVYIHSGCTEEIEDDLWQDIVELIAWERETPEDHNLTVI
jgi:hypothetical protein